MAKLKLRSKDLKRIGFPKGPATALAIDTMQKHYRRHSKDHVLTLLEKLLANPKDYAEDEHLGRIVTALNNTKTKPRPTPKTALKEQSHDFNIFGQDGIQNGAIEQMRTAMRLPITLAGALMPDAHLGYGLPIGGVLAVDNAVIPYGVGMDIGCRMCLSIYNRNPEDLNRKTSNWKDILLQNTRFGLKEFARPLDDEVLHSPLFREIPLLKPLKNKARKQIGTSGSGNHFVEFGIVDIRDSNNEFTLPTGKYLALLSHSGSRGLGANIAKHYTKIAMQQRRLPKIAKHLAWLTLDSEEGQEYWLAMNLAGDYASACHHQIHRRIAEAIGEKPLATVENHHNFAWKEKLEDGREVIVHRKGATPAGKGVLGIIPGSMTAPGFIVRGTGAAHSLHSASHGAGRQMSRSKARNSTTRHALQKHLKEKGVTLIGGGLDEAPFAYKDIHEVMAHQRHLIEVLGTFSPKIVRME